MKRKPLRGELVWSSVEFGEHPLPIVWVRPRRSPAGEPTGLPLTFANVADMRRMVNTLSGWLASHELLRKERRSK